MKSGGEAFVIGTQQTDVKVPQNEKVSIMVECLSHFFVNVWILGAILEVPISQLCFPVCDFQEDRKRITWCSHPDLFTCVINSPEKKSKFKGMKSFIAYNIIPSVSMCSPKVV